MAKISLEVVLPDRLLQAFLQHVRTFEAQNTKEMHVQMWVTETGLTQEQMLAVFRSLRPAFPYEGVFPRTDA